MKSFSKTQGGTQQKRRAIGWGCNEDREKICKHFGFGWSLPKLREEKKENENQTRTNDRKPTEGDDKRKTKIWPVTYNRSSGKSFNMPGATNTGEGRVSG